jgi:TrmH family RNA methyltransferase
LPAHYQSELTPAGPGHPLVRQYLAARRQRQAPGVVALEGYWAIETALAAGRPLEALFVMPPLGAGPAPALVSMSVERRAPVFRVGPKLFGRMVDRDGPDGLAALVGWRSWTLEDILVGPTARVLVSYRPDRPGNLGAMVRCADGAGASGVIVADSVLALSSQAVVKASMGTIFSLPAVATTSEEALTWLRSRGFRIVAAQPDGDRSYRDGLYRPPVAVVVGNERRGLSPEWSQAAHCRAAIPMGGRADSLNVTTAAALLLYEALQQCHPRP